MKIQMLFCKPQILQAYSIKGKQESITETIDQPSNEQKVVVTAPRRASLFQSKSVNKIQTFENSLIQAVNPPTIVEETKKQAAQDFEKIQEEKIKTSNIIKNDIMTQQESLKQRLAKRSKSKSGNTASTNRLNLKSQSMANFNRQVIPSDPVVGLESSESQPIVVSGMSSIFQRVQMMSENKIKQQEYNFSQIIGGDDITQLKAESNDSEPRITATQIKAVFESDSNLGNSVSQENKSSSSFSLIDSNSNSTPQVLSPLEATNQSPEDARFIFNLAFDQKVQVELQKISAKYLQQIEAYEKKGLNALTKKLIEKTQLEMQKAETKRKDELERERQEEIDKILNGVSSLGISQMDLQIEELKSRE